MNVKSKYIERGAYAWIYSGIIIFLLGFLKLYIAIPVACVSLFALFLVFRSEGEETFRVNTHVIIVGVIVIFVWMALCGQGGFFPQGNDWDGRNAQLYDLVEYRWPVYYANGSAFTYYLAHFLLPALIGKMFGLGAARAMLMIYTAMGVCLIWMYMIKILKANTAMKQIFALLLLMFFGNTENIHTIMANSVTGVFHLQSNTVSFGFTTNFNSFAWVFNQVTCAFLVLCMFFDDDSRVENFMVIGVPMLLFSPFMLIETVVIFALGTVKELIKSKNDLKGFMKRLFSIHNLCILIGLFPVILIYLSGNVFAEKPDSLSFGFVSYRGRFLAYILFVLFQFLLFSILLFPKYKKNWYFYAANVMLLILPFFKMGLYNDLVSRGSSVGLFVLMLLSGEFMLNCEKTYANKIRRLLLCTLILCVAVPHINNSINAVTDASAEIARHEYHKKWLENYHSLDGLSERFGGDDLKYNFYTFDAKDHFFFKYMARK